MSGKYVNRGYFALSRLHLSDFFSTFYFEVQQNYMFLKNNKENWIHTVICHMLGEIFDIKQFKRFEKLKLKIWKFLGTHKSRNSWVLETWVLGSQVLVAGSLF